jgi:uncharacterized cupin superfamily protein
VADVTIKRLDEFEAIYGGAFKRVRAGLGVTSFGMAVMDIPPGMVHYPEHNHLHDGQEEVFTVLEGRCTLRVGGEDGTEYQLEPGTFVRIGQDELRKFETGDEGVRLLALGGTPGAVYHPPEFSEEGAPDPVKGAPESVPLPE